MPDERLVKPNGKRIRELRKAAGHSLEEFAAYLEISTGTLGPIERSNKPCFATTLHAIADGLNRTKKVTTSYEELILSPATGDNQPDQTVITCSVFQLPPPLRDFVGRKEQLDAMVARLSGTGGKVGLSALRGMGGVGKTSLAVLVANEVKAHFPDAQLFLELRGVSDAPVTAVEAMSRVIRDFHPESGKLPDTEAELLPIYRSVLSGKRALIVLDNAKDEAQVKPLLSAGPSVAFLITSRNALMLDGVDAVRIDVLPPDEAFQLLRDIVGAKGTDAELRTVAELCGRLPLALRVAGDFLRIHSNWTVAKYTEALRDEAKRLERLKGKTADRDVEAVLALSAIELVKENAERAERWQMLSVFPADFDAQAAAAVWELDDGATLDELTAFLDRSLLDHNADTDRYDLHDLLRPVARETFDYVDNHPLQAGAAKRVGSAEHRFARHFCNVLAAADDLYLKGNDGVLAGLGLFDQEVTNIRHGWVLAYSNRKLLSGAELCQHYLAVGVSVKSLRHSAREQIIWAETARDAARQFPNRLSEGTALLALGHAYAVLGDARTALGFFEETLTIAREIGNKNVEETALGNLGVAKKNLGDTPAAILCFEQQLTLSRQIGNRRAEGTVLGNLGGVHLALGDAPTAISYIEQHLTVARELGDRRGEGNALGNLGVAHHYRGDDRAAIEYHEQHLTVARELGDRSGEGDALGNLGVAYFSLDDARTAATYHEQALAISRDLGARRAEGSDLGNLGLAHLTLGDAGTAKSYLEQALVIAREIGNLYAEAQLLGNLGHAHESLGDDARAIDYFSQNLLLARKIGDRRGELFALGSLGQVYTKVGRLHAARSYFEPMLELHRTIGDREGEGRTALQLAIIFEMIGQRDVAIRHAADALAIFEAMNHPHTEMIRHQLAKWRGEA